MLKLNQFIYLVFILILSCNSEKNTDDNVINKDKISKSEEKPKTKKISPKDLNTTKLLITDYKKNGYYNNSSLETTLMTIDKYVIEKFENLLKEYKINRYACCLERSQIISFYNKSNEKFKHYYIDTLATGKFITITQDSYQYSYQVPIAKWKKTIKLLNKVTYNTYFILDMKEAREVYNYVAENDLIIINNSQTSIMWPFFDGKFAVTISDIGKTKSEDQIKNKINKAYPSETFKIINLNKDSWTSNIGDEGERYDEYTAIISCNKEFYEKFNIYNTKTFYKKNLAWFVVLGTKSKLNGIDSISEKTKEK